MTTGIKSETDQRLQPLARAIAQKTAGAGLTCLVRDSEGRAHVIPGHAAEVIAVYGPGVKIKWILDDLIDAGIQR